MAVLNYRDLIVWQKGLDFAEMIYRVTKKFPREEIYGLTNQLRRASVSIPSNIAEGQGRGSGKAFSNHVLIAQGSIQEAETQIILSDRLDFVTKSEFDELMQRADELSRMNRGLFKSIRI